MLAKLHQGWKRQSHPAISLSPHKARIHKRSLRRSCGIFDRTAPMQTTKASFEIILDVLTAFLTQEVPEGEVVTSVGTIPTRTPIQQ